MFPVHIYLVFIIMYKFSKLLLLILILLHISCNRNSEIQNVIIDPKSNQVIHLSDIVESVRYIPLEITDNSVIGKIRYVYSYNNYYIVVSNNVICVYDKEGKFISNIGSRGRANNEYLYITKAMFDERNAHIIIYDQHGNKLLYYTLSGECDKVYVLKNDIRNDFQDIINLPNGNFLVYKYIHVSRNSKTINSIREILPTGDVVATHWEEKVVQPSVVGSYNMSYAKNGNIAISSHEIVGEMQFNGEMDTIVMYNVNGPTSKTYEGIGNKEYSNNWINGKMFNACSWSTHIGRYILTKWSGEDNGNTFYSLYDCKNSDIQVGTRFDFITNDGSMALPSLVGNPDCADAIDVVPTNMKDAIIVPIFPELFITSNKYSKYKHIVGNIENIEDTNPVLQIWNLKSN